MGNKLLLLTLGILLISFSSATSIFSGDTINLELDKPFAYYSIVGNSSPFYLDIIQQGNNVTITFDKYMKNDSFEIVFFDIEKEVITVYSGGGKSSTNTITKIVNNTIIEEVPTIKYIENKTTEIHNIEVNKIPFWALGFIIFGSIVIITFLIKWLLPNKEVKNE